MGNSCFQVVALLTAFVAATMQVASIAGPGWVQYLKDNSKLEIGLFSVCAKVTDVTVGGIKDGSSMACQFTPSYLDLFGDTFCVKNNENVKTSDIIGKIRGAEALGMMTLFVAVGHVTLVLLYVCDKLNNAVPTFITAAISSAGAMGTFIIFFTAVNNSCDHTLCEMLTNGSGGSCIGSYGYYLEMFSIMFSFISAVLICCVKRARIANADVQPLTTPCAA